MTKVTIFSLARLGKRKERERKWLKMFSLLLIRNGLLASFNSQLPWHTIDRFAYIAYIQKASIKLWLLCMKGNGAEQDREREGNASLDSFGRRNRGTKRIIILESSLKDVQRLFLFALKQFQVGC